MGWIQRVLSLATGIIILLVFLYLIPYFPEICRFDNHSNHEQCTAYHIPPFVLIKIFDILNDYSPAITGLATIAIATFTYILYAATKETARITDASLKLARQEFNSTHRPHIGVRAFEFLQSIGYLRSIYLLQRWWFQSSHI